VTIGDFIWLDSNSNGIQDAGENGINGVKVNIFACTQNNVPSGPPLSQVTTQTVATVAGTYTFTMQTCLPVQWLIEIDASNFSGGGPLQNLSESSPFVGGNPASNTDSNCTNRTSDCRPINAGTTDLTVDCGFIPPTPTPTNTPTNTPTETPTLTPTPTFTQTRPPVPVVPSPTSPAGLLMIGGLGIGLLWALRRFGSASN
jgi:hypothetical protein